MEKFPVIIEVSSWDCVAQAAKQYYADEVGLAINPYASLLFATELVGAFDPENKVGAFQVVNPEIARCKAEVHKRLLPHVAALSGWARNVSQDVDKVTRAVHEMRDKFGASERGEIFTDLSKDAKVLEPVCRQEAVYVMPRPGKTERHTIRRRLTAEEKKGPPRMTPLPNGIAIQTAMHRSNLEFVQGKLRFLAELEEKVQVFSSEMHDLVLGGTSLGSGRTVVDFLDVDTTGVKVHRSTAGTPQTKLPGGDEVTMASAATKSTTVAATDDQSETPTEDRTPKKVVTASGEVVRKSAKLINLAPGTRPESCKTPDCTKSGKSSKRTPGGTPTKDLTPKHAKKAKFQKDGHSP